jgi:hypothetical protein
LPRSGSTQAIDSRAFHQLASMAKSSLACLSDEFLQWKKMKKRKERKTSILLLILIIDVISKKRFFFFDS